MIISIHDYANNRTIVANVPQYLITANRHDTDHEAIALAIFSALGLNQDETEYMMSDDMRVCLDLDVINSSEHCKGYIKLEELTQNFEEDALAALAALAESND
jgi:hypothetical protein